MQVEVDVKAQGKRVSFSNRKANVGKWMRVCGSGSGSGSGGWSNMWKWKWNVKAEVEVAGDAVSWGSRVIRSGVTVR